MDSTKKDAHSRRATIYDGNRLAVERGVNGSTASAHSADDALYMTALKVVREQAGSKVAEHAKNTEIFLGNELNITRGVLGTAAAQHENGALVRNFPAPPDSPATNFGHTCSQPQVQAGQTPIGPPPTPVPGAQVVKVSLKEWSVTPDTPSVPAGPVQFDVTNDGTAQHNFRVIKTELASDKLPVSNSAADESQLDVVAASAGTFIAIGAGDTVSAQLAPSSYVLICNVPTHYQLGMRVAFTVQ